MTRIYCPFYSASNLEMSANGSYSDIRRCRSMSGLPPKADIRLRG